MASRGQSGKQPVPDRSPGAASSGGAPDVTKDNYIPVFDGQPSSYREYRKRVMLYYKKMVLNKRSQEATINLLTSFSGHVWKQVEHLAETAPDAPDGFEQVLKQLDRVYQYDPRVEMPKAFERYFYGVSRTTGQTLMQYCSEHREAERELEKYDVKLPDAVSGWLLLRRASLSQEQRQLILSQMEDKKITTSKVEEVMYFLFGQDYKATSSWRTTGNDQRSFGKGKGYTSQRSWNHRTAYPAYYHDDFEYAEPDGAEPYADESAFQVDYDDAPEDEETWAEEATDHDYSPDTAFYEAEDYDEEEEEAFATYLDARRKLAEVRSSRGYYPVVALVDGPGHQSQLPVTATAPPSGKGKGKQKGKTKKGSNSAKGSPSGKSKAPARAAATQCLRCGQPGHWASQCPTKVAASTGGSPTKRPKPSDAMMVSGPTPDVEVHELAADVFGRCVGIQDGGASSVVTGHGYLMKLLDGFLSQGVSAEEFRFSRTDKTFLFGGDNRAQASWCIHLPVWVGGTKGRIQCFIVEGNMPLLVGRPVLKALKVKTDYELDRCSVMDEPWSEALQGSKGEYLLAIDDGLTEDTGHIFDYVTDDKVEDFIQSIPLDTLQTYLEDSGRSGPEHALYTSDDLLGGETDPTDNDAGNSEDHLVPAHSQTVPAKLWKTLQAGVRRAVGHVYRVVDTAYRAVTKDKPLFWEVFSGSGGLAAAMAENGFEVQIFDEPEWNFDLPDHRKAFLEKLEAERPHVIWLAPSCTLWTPTQNLNCQTPLQQELLYLDRQAHHARHLKFVRRIFKRMCASSVIVVVHPASSAAWRTPAFHGMGRSVRVDQCMLGAQLPDESGVFYPIQKAIRLASNDDDLLAELSGYRCNKEHYHLTLLDNNASLGSRVAATADVCEIFARHLTEAYHRGTPMEHGFVGEIANTSSGEGTSDDAVMPDTDAPRPTGALAQLSCTSPAVAARLVARIHRNLGHPSNKDLRKILQDHGAGDVVLDTAAGYECPVCARLAPPPQVPKTNLRSTYKFNERLLADTVWLQVAGKPTPVLTMLDSATRYLAARVLNSETSSEFLRALQRGWIRTFGAPAALHVDSHRGWGSAEVRDFATEHNFEIVVSPGEAHERLAQLERRHQVLRKAVDVYMEEHNSNTMDGLVEALTFVVPALNQTLSVGGYSPAQWVLGYQPSLPGSLLDSQLNPSHLHPTEAFQKNMMARATAATAVIKADADLRLRRALLRQHRGEAPLLHVGQRCYYWREAAGPGPRVRWKGPATVVLVEQGHRALPTVYWLVHGTALIRAAPEHVRPDIESTTLAGSGRDLLTLVRDVQNRGTTTYTDLVRTNKKRALTDVAPDSDEEMFEPDADDPRFTPGPFPPGGAVGPTLSSTTSTGFPPASPIPTAETPDVPELSTVTPTSLAPTSPVVSPMLPENLPKVPSDLIDTDLEQYSPSASDRPANAADHDQEDNKPQEQQQQQVGGAIAAQAIHPSYAPQPGESFHERRARLDRQETIAYGPQLRRPESASTPYGPRPVTDQRPPTAAQAKESLVEQSFLVDVLPPDSADAPGLHENLPAGWFVEDGYLCLEPIHDVWEMKGNQLIRHHYVARDTLFHPEETGDCPIPTSMLTKTRHTCIGSHRHEDRWRSGTSTPAEPWTGRTIFKIQPRDRRGASEAFYTASAGQHTYAGTAAKRKKDAKSLTERTMSLSDRLAFMEAKRKELASFFTNNVWEFSTEDEAVPGRVLKAHFILKWSKHPDGSPRAKARLITQGFRDPDALAGNLESTSPTLSRLGRSCLLSLAANKSWGTFVADISTAFLQGQEHPAERTLWIRLPKDARDLLGISSEKTCMRLRKPMYGLIDAPRSWYLEAVRRLQTIGFVRHPLDGCLFCYYALDANGAQQLVCAIGLHVDDLLGVADQPHPAYEQIKADLKNQFAFRDFRENQNDFEFLGAKLSQLDEGGFRYDHQDYLHKVKPIPIEKNRQAAAEEPVTEKERTGLIGATQWAATQTSPHLQVMTSMLAGTVQKSTVNDLLAANKMLRFAKANNDAALEYTPLGDLNDLTFVAFSDAAFATRDDLASQGGYLILMVHKDVVESGVVGRYHVLDWRSFKLPRVARSTLAAESQAASEAADCLHYTVCFYKALLDPDLKFNSKDAFLWPNKPALVVDAKCLYDLLARDELQATSGSDKRTALETLTTKDKLKEIGATTRWISSERQYADGLTKNSAAQLLANRLRTHQVKLVADETYQAARKKTAQERAQSANQFALPRARAGQGAVGTAFFVTSVVANIVPTTAAELYPAVVQTAMRQHVPYTDVLLDVLASLTTVLCFFIGFLTLYCGPPERLVKVCRRCWSRSIQYRNGIDIDVQTESIQYHNGIDIDVQTETVQYHNAIDLDVQTETVQYRNAFDIDVQTDNAIDIDVQTETLQYLDGINVNIQTDHVANAHVHVQTDLQRARQGVTLEQAFAINRDLAHRLRALQDYVRRFQNYRARYHTLGDVYLCPFGEVYHHSFECANQRTDRVPVRRRPCNTCCNEVIEGIPGLPPIPAPLLAAVINVPEAPTARPTSAAASSTAALTPD